MASPQAATPPDISVLEAWRNYDFDKFKLSDLPRRVTAIHVCALETPSRAGPAAAPPTNRWATYLAFADGGSVGVEMAGGRGHDGRRGRVRLASNPFPYPTDEVKLVRVPVARPRTVREVLEAVNAAGRDRYRVAEDGEGGAFWTWLFVRDLQAAGVVAAGSSAVVWGAVQYYWRRPRGTGAEPRDVRRGTFYEMYPSPPGEEREAAGESGERADGSAGLMGRRRRARSVGTMVGERRGRGPGARRTLRSLTTLRLRARLRG